MVFEPPKIDSLYYMAQLQMENIKDFNYISFSDCFVAVFLFSTWVRCEKDDECLIKY